MSIQKTNALVKTPPVEQHKNDAPLTPRKTVDKSNVVKEGFRIRFHTTEVWRIFTGRKDNEYKRHIHSWRQFRYRVIAIYTLAIQENPYALGVLILLERQLNKAQERVIDFGEYAESAIRKSSLREIRPHSTFNQNRSIWIESPHQHGYIAAHLLDSFDKAMQTMKTAEFLGLIPTVSTYNRFSKIRDNVRRILTLPAHFANKLEPLTADDIRNETPTALRMEKRFGCVNEAILNGELRPQWLKLPADYEAPPKGLNARYADVS